MMKKYKKMLPVLLFSALTSLSCTDKKEARTGEKAVPEKVQDSVGKYESDSNDAQDILGTFYNIPPEIQGCSCYYSLTEADFKEEIYVFAAEMEEYGFAHMEGLLVRFEPVVTAEPDTPAYSKKEYESGIYKIVIETETISEDGETRLQKGTMKVFKQGKQTDSVAITGECGC
jgi:hypothetical protein